MAERILYEFDGFQLDPSTGRLVFDGKTIPLRAKPFELLLTLVENHGRVMMKEDLVNRVWPGALVTDANFHVNLNAIRKALGEEARKPRFILRTGGGYKFVADVREVAVAHEHEASLESGRDARAPSKHVAHVTASSLFYGAYFAVALLLEVTYQFDRFGHTALKIAPVVLFSMILSAVVSLEIDRRLTLKVRNSGLVGSAICLLLTAAVLFGFMTRFLPAVPITESVLQTYPAQAAYLKDMSYELVLAVLFVLMPFHFIITAERRLAPEKLYVKSEQQRAKSLQRAPYWSFWALVGLLLVFLIMSVAMTARLLDNLKPNPYQNLFVQLVYLRALLFFGLGIECLAWYRNALNEIKSEYSRLESRSLTPS